MKKLILWTLVVILNSSLYAQSEEVCDGRYESILHDSNSGINQNSMSGLAAYEKGYNLTLKQDIDKITITQNNTKEIYIKDKNNKEKYIHNKDKTKYLLKLDDQEHNLYMYTKEILVKYYCESAREKLYEEEVKVEKAYTIFSKFIKRGQAYLFENEGIVVELFDIGDKKKEEERDLFIYLVNNEDYMLSLWCGPGKKDYLDGLTVEEEDFEYYVCADPCGKVQIKINKNGFYIIPEYIAVGKEMRVNGYLDIDRKEISTENYTFIKGTPIK